MSHPGLSHLQRRARRTGEAHPPFRERIAALRYVPKLIGLVWETHRGYAGSMVVLRVVRAFVPVTQLWAWKLIIDAVVRIVTHGGSVNQLWPLVAFQASVVVVGEMLARGSSLVESLLGDLFTNRISVRIMEHAATLDLPQFEDPEFYDHLERARRGTAGRIGLLTQLVGMGQDALTLTTLIAVLVSQSVWLLILLVVTVLPSFLGETHYAALSYSLLFRFTPERRQLDYVRFVGASNESAKEVQMFGLGPWLIERYRVLADRFYNANRRLVIRRAGASAGLSLLGTAGYYVAAIVVLLRAARGVISIGTLTFLIGSLQQGQGLIQRLLMSASDIIEQSLYLGDLFVFFEAEPAIHSRTGAVNVPRPFREGFVFEDVGFRYPGTDHWAVRHASFVLRPGERVALVGENGAGKTTITKLIARLYDPTEGRILLDGVDLRDYDLGSVRQAIGVIFQDFVRYDMRFDENVGVGEIETVREYLDQPSIDRQPAGEAGANGAGAEPKVVSPGTLAPPRIVTAAEKSLAASLLPRMAAGYRQMLGRRFDDGVDLSGGEWQKVALARAYMRDAQLLILDEPTAALDARAEYDVFLRFNELMAGRMAIVISHRFSTVRMADRIIVLRKGQVVEQGTHQELVAGDGLYAELFQMQAAGYR